MTRLAYPDPAHVAHVMQDFPVSLRHMNIGKTVSHASTLVAPYYNTYAALLQELELDPKLRQLAILRVTGRASAPYVLVQHRALSRLAGLATSRSGRSSCRTSTVTASRTFRSWFSRSPMR
jgi:hypothetical protein